VQLWREDLGLQSLGAIFSLPLALINISQGGREFEAIDLT